MPAVILKLLTLVALALMPLGMGAASAAPAHLAPPAATQGHCDEQGRHPAQPSPNEVVECAMACSMMATPEARADEPAPSPGLALGRPLAESGAGLHPDTATPPPKFS